MSEIRHSSDLNKDIDDLLNEGYRLDMITPADSPREVQLSKNREIVRLVLSSDGTSHEPAKSGTHNGWIQGRAGMEYRDLMPSRLGGKLIASHIRLSKGGEVPDYVHYHKVLFQLIYCLSGRIRVVYEDQGPPFWLAAGDCVLQPPEIRHRVLETEAGSEVLEISAPAEHETWVEHEMSLPTAVERPERLFGGQRFVRSIASEASWQPGGRDGVAERDLGIYDATNGLAEARVRRMENPDVVVPFSPRPGMTGLGFVVAGRRKTNGGSHPVDQVHKRASTATEILRLEFKDSAFDR